MWLAYWLAISSCEVEETETWSRETWYECEEGLVEMSREWALYQALWQKPSNAKQTSVETVVKNN